MNTFSFVVLAALLFWPAAASAQLNVLMSLFGIMLSMKRSFCRRRWSVLAILCQVHNRQHSLEEDAA